MATNIRVGVDVGTHSLGMSAIRVDENGMPLELLSTLSLIHDSGIDKDGMKTATTKLAASGVARRTRRMFRQRRRRLAELDSLLESLGYPLTDVSENVDTYLPWQLRARLASEPLERGSAEAAMAIAFRHIARHRGWRNPYSGVESLLSPAPESTFLAAVRTRIMEKTGEVLDTDLTPGQIMAQVALTPAIGIRGEKGLLGKIHQSDNANEIRKICAMQGVSDEDCTRIIKAVFLAKSPRGSADKRAGLDPLPGQHGLHRAPKCLPSFQKFRVVSIVANLRIREGNGQRELTPAERKRVANFLLADAKADTSWVDVADLLEISRSSLRGTAVMTADGERSSARPPYNVTEEIMRACKIKPLKAWWGQASNEQKEALVSYLYAGQENDEIDELVSSLSDDDHAKLDELHLPSGRAAYSADSLDKLTAQMLSTEDDLHAARIHVFGVSEDWAPPAEPIGAPVGNPAVDRVTKGFARWLHAVESQFGVPDSIQIEHVRDGLGSERMARERDRENNRRYAQNQKTIAQIREAYGIEGAVRSSDVSRYEAVIRQDCQCVYCGTEINFRTAQMDHIVPQAGVGSNSRRENLVASCETCNRSKSNTAFAVWAAEGNDKRPKNVSIDGAKDRVRAWKNTQPGNMNAKQLNLLKKEVIARLSRTESDPELDARSMESVAWMANELHQRVKAAYPDADVMVYRGAITAGARRAAGIDSKVNLLGERDRKDRLDRRHHAVDASVVALIRPGIAKTLVERANLRRSEHLRGVPETWKSHTGSSPAAREHFAQWVEQMQRLTELLNIALAEDAIPVTENLRLRLGNGAAHDDTVRDLARKPVGETFSVEEIDRASTPALWCALTRQSDFDQKDGLPADPTRTIRVNGKQFGAEDSVELFKKSAAAIAVRGGFVEIGSTVHHARVYRIRGKKDTFAMLRVFTVDLLPHRKEDLFSAEIPPQSISMRSAEPKLRKAIADGTAEYLGWLVVGDELEIPMESFKSGLIGDFLEEFPGTTTWRVHGFNDPAKLRLRPAKLSSEGLSNDPSEAAVKTLDRPGWRPSINTLFQTKPTVIRRDSLGRPRWSSSRGLPTCWTVE